METIVEAKSFKNINFKKEEFNSFQKAKLYYLMNGMKYLVNEHEKSIKVEYVENFNKISETYEEYAFNKENT